MSKQILRRIEGIREELEKPIPEHLITKEKGKMVRKKTATKKTAPKKTSRKRTEETEDSGNGDDRVTLAYLAEEADISPQQARQKLRAAGIEREDGKRWSWSPKSKALTSVKKALGL